LTFGSIMAMASYEFRIGGNNKRMSDERSLP
jgi:hypothetical protein